MAKKARIKGAIVAQNRRARHDYFIQDTIEAGLELRGSEVKSLRAGRCSINEAYAADQDGELYLLNAHIPEYPAAGVFQHEPKRSRKLLLHRREMARLAEAVSRKGMALVPLAIYFNPRGIAKLELALAEGKQRHDKRDTVKERDWQRQKARLLRERG